MHHVTIGKGSTDPNGNGASTTTIKKISAAIRLETGLSETGLLGRPDKCPSFFPPAGSGI
jgi:hypothetical protein